MGGGAGEEERTGRTTQVQPWTLWETAHTSFICLHGSRRNLACQSAGWLGALFLNQHPVVSVRGRWGVWPLRSSQIAVVLLLKERMVSRSCDVGISNGLWGPLLLRIHVLTCSYGHLFTARPWAPRDSVVSRKHVSLSLPCLCCGLPFSRLDYSHTQQAPLRQTRPWSQATWA